jgi:4-carboxymuconolactone decarboxylase
MPRRRSAARRSSAGCAPPLAEAPIEEKTMDKTLLEQGLRLRREVLGADRVERAYDSADAFNRPFQELMTEYCWGACWGRPGLDKKTRSMLNLITLVALNRRDEFKLHVGGALENGVSEEEIQEILIQAAIYCGIPAAVSAFKDASEVLVARRAD